MRLTEEQRKLAEDNRWLAVAFARKVAGGRYYHDDMAAEMLYALTRAAASYDPAIGVRFSTYSRYWLQTAANKFRYALPIVCIPAYHYDTSGDGRASRERHADLVKRIREAKCFGAGVANTLPHEASAEGFEAIDQKDERNWVWSLVRKLHTNQRRVMEGRLRGLLQREVGVSLGLSRPQVSDIEKQAIVNLRKLVQGSEGN